MWQYRRHVCQILGAAIPSKEQFEAEVRKFGHTSEMEVSPMEMLQLLSKMTLRGIEILTLLEFFYYHLNRPLQLSAGHLFERVKTYADATLPPTPRGGMPSTCSFCGTSAGRRVRTPFIVDSSPLVLCPTHLTANKAQRQAVRQVLEAVERRVCGEAMDSFLDATGTSCSSSRLLHILDLLLRTELRVAGDNESPGGSADDEGASSRRHFRFPSSAFLFFLEAAGVLTRVSCFWDFVVGVLAEPVEVHHRRAAPDASCATGANNHENGASQRPGDEL